MRHIITEVNIYDVRMDVSGYYYPEEPTEWYDDNMSGHPGYGAEFEIESVGLEGIEISQIISDEVYNKIIEQVIEQQS